MNVNTQIAAGSKNTKRAFVFRCVFIRGSCDRSRAVLDPKDCQAWKDSMLDSSVGFTCSLSQIDSSPIADLDPDGQ